MPINVTNFLVEPPQVRESEGLVRMGQTMQRNRELDYRMAKDQEQDQWRKLNLIQELTDLSKHQTGSDVANALGNKLMADIYQKYTANVDKMQPNQLQADVQRDMAGIITGMEGAKMELSQADQQVDAIKKLYPNLDAATLYDHVRKDIVNRRLDDKAGSFRNQMEVLPPQIDLSNPEILSEYLTNTKSLDEEIANPKGVDPISVAVGDDIRNTEFGGKIPWWMKPNYTDEDLKKGKGFLPRGFLPTLSIKSETLPTDFLPSLQGQQRNIVTRDVHKQFKERYPLEVLAGTKQMFPTYSKMNEGEKELAERDYLYNKIKALDRSALNYKSSKTPSASMLRLSMGLGSGESGLNVNDIYERIHDKAKQQNESYKSQSGDKTYTNAVEFSDLNQDEQKVVKEQALLFDKDINGEDLQLIITPEDKVGIYMKEDGRRVGYLDPHVNLKVQPGVKEKRKVIADAKQQGATYHIKGKNYSEAELLKMGYSLEDIKEYKK